MDGGRSAGHLTALPPTQPIPVPPRPQYHLRIMTLRREARLRPQFADRYPGVPPGAWMPAADLGAALLVSHLHSATPPRLGSRLLDETHFEFRGGAPRAEPALRTRREDR